MRSRSMTRDIAAPSSRWTLSAMSPEKLCDVSSSDTAFEKPGLNLAAGLRREPDQQCDLTQRQDAAQRDADVPAGPCEHFGKRQTA